MAIAPSSRYKRVTAALDERARERLWSGSSSDSSSGSSPELSDLVDSFYGCEDREATSDVGSGEGEGKAAVMERGVLVGLAIGGRDEEEARVAEAVESAAARVLAGGGDAGEEEKRKMVWLLRRSGFDAGLCRSKPEETSTTAARSSKTRLPPQSRHVYIDVVAAGGARYVVELNLAAEFEIARPTAEYASLLAARVRRAAGEAAGRGAAPLRGGGGVHAGPGDARAAVEEEGVRAGEVARVVREDHGRGRARRGGGGELPEGGGSRWAPSSARGKRILCCNGDYSRGVVILIWFFC